MARREVSQARPGSAIADFCWRHERRFPRGRPDEVIGRVCATIAMSDHIGLLLTKRTARMAEYFAKQSPAHCAAMAIETLVWDLAPNARNRI